ncbi:hypothetical protein AYI68_g7866, partial [Smittium mucronatum]
MQLYAPIDICRVIREDGVNYEWAINPLKPIIEVSSSNIITYDIHIGKVVRDVTIKFENDFQPNTDQLVSPLHENTPYFYLTETPDSSEFQENDILNLNSTENIDSEDLSDTTEQSSDFNSDPEIYQTDTYYRD